MEARIAALEASRADYRAVLAAINALGSNQHEHGLGLAEVRTAVADLKIDLGDLKVGLADLRQETRGRFRSIDERLADIKDLIIGRNGA